MKYAYLSYIAIILLAILTAVQFYIYMKSSDEKGCNHECGCGHDHDHEKDKPFLQRMFIYFVFFFPLCTGLFLPAATLDSNIVKSKGFSFKAIEQPEHYAQTQYLRPDTSIYYGQDGYDELMNKALKKYKEKQHITLKDDDFLKGMETIYHYPGEFLDRTLEFDGFAFKGKRSVTNSCLSSASASFIASPTPASMACWSSSLKIWILKTTSGFM